MYIGKIKYVKDNEIRVLVYGVFDDDMPTTNYPKAILTSSLNIKNGIGINNKISVGDNVICAFLNGDYSQPIILGFINNENDTKESWFNSNTMDIKTKSGYGISIRNVDENKNFDIDFDGEININKTDDNYKSVLKQLNDLRDILNSFINKYNTHKHETLNSQGIKGKALGMGETTNIQGDKSIPELNEAAIRAAIPANLGIDPVTGLTAVQIGAMLAINIPETARIMAILSGETESTDGDYNVEFKSKSK